MDLVNFVASLIRNVDLSAIHTYMVLNHASYGSKLPTGAMGAEVGICTRRAFLVPTIGLSSILSNFVGK